jgi:hypothetical protein
VPRRPDTRNQQQPIEPARIEEVASNAFSAFDAQRPTSLQAMASVRLGRNAVLSRQRAKLVAQGGAQAEDVKAIDATIADNASAAGLLSMHAARATTQVQAPTAQPNEWVLYGGVNGADYGPAPSLTVALYADGIRVTGVACDTTGKDGQYLLRVPMQLFAASDHARAAPGGNAPVPALAPGATTPAKADSPAPVVTVRILDAAGKCLLDVPDEFTPLGGASDALFLLLPATAGANSSAT